MQSARQASDGSERLTESELIELDDALCDAPDAPREPHVVNRRRFERVEFSKSVRITEIDDFGNPASDWDCRVVDLSRGGLGLRSRRMVHQGRSVLIEVPGVGGAKVKVLFGIVRQSRYAEGEGYAVGIEFRALPQTAPIRAWAALRGLAA